MAHSQATPAASDTAEIAAAAERVLESALFSRSPRLREFLTFVVKCTVENRAHEVNEYSLGLQVFGKGPNYNPNLDNIVRVTARQLRQRLAEYYAGEGAGAAVRLEIPKGSYLPHLVPNVPNEVTPEAAPPRKWMPVALALCGLLAVAGWGTAWRLWSRAAPVTAEPAHLLGPLLDDGSRTVSVVLDDPILSRAWRQVGGMMTLNEFAAGRFLDPSYYHGPEGVFLRKLLGDNYFVHLSSLQIMMRISKISASHGKDVVPIHARVLAPDKMENGNFVFIGGVGSNPWVGEIQKHLAFEHRVEPKEDTRTFINRTPQPGEAAVFESGPQTDSGSRYYTRVALLRNPFGSGRILLLGGTSRDATEAAGQFALSQTGDDEVRRLCGVPVDRLQGVELILETKSVAGAPLTRTVVASRCRQ